MTIAFMGGEMGGFLPLDGTAKETTISSYYDSGFSRAALYAGDLSYDESADFGALTDFWVHCHQYADTYSGGTVDHLTFVDGSGTERIRTRYNRSTLVTTVEYYNGAWNVAGSITANMTAHQDLDFHFVVNSASGSINVYFSGTNRLSVTGLDLSATTSIHKMRVKGANYGAKVSQVVVSTNSTIGGRLWTVPINGAGATSSWTGTYANIDEAIYSDADFINSSVANQVSTFSVSAPTLTGYVVQAVAVCARANRGASGPQNLQLALRSSGTDYFSASKALDVAYGPFVNVWETDPATSAAWVNTAVPTLQPGVKSIA